MDIVNRTTHCLITHLHPDHLDIFQPLLMSMEDIAKFVKNSPIKVIANHLEAVNHCPITRKELASELNDKGLIERTLIPEDGQVMEFE